MPNTTKRFLIITCASATRCLAGDGFVTTNGGATWAFGIKSLAFVQCARASTHCVGSDAGGHVFYSSNGGTSWTQSTFPGAIKTHTNPVCASPTLCFALATTTTDVGVTRSTNGGASYGPLTSMGVVDDGETANHMISLACRSTTQCIAAGQTHSEGELPSDYWFMMRTTNAGTSWGSAYAAYSTAALTCSTQRCYVEDDRIATTDNLASTAWTDRLTIAAAGDSSGLACNDTTHCIQIGAFARPRESVYAGVAVSTDGGSTWSDTARDFIGASRLACVTALHCWFTTYNVGEADMTETLDGGVTWNDPKNQLFDELDIGCPTSTHCIGLGDFFGNTQYDWTPTNDWVTSDNQSPPDSGPIVCGSPTRCYLINDVGTFVTPDQGATWTQLAGSPVSTIACVSATTCLGTTYAGIARTTDGGVTWHPSHSGGNLLTCNAAGRCLGAASGGIIDSHDGGVTWVTDQVSGPGPAAIGDYARCRGTACVIAGGGMTLRTP